MDEGVTSEAGDRLSTSPPKSKWRAFVDGVKDLGELAKFIALLLVIIGFVGLYIPGLRMKFEVIANPTAWYYIGGAANGIFSAEHFQNPLWPSGRGPEVALERLPGTTMVTYGNGLHIGRSQDGADKAIRTNYSGGICLFVKQISKRTRPGDKAHYIWAEAVKVSC